MTERKKPTMELSPHVILTNSGVGFFIGKGRKLGKITTVDGPERYGIKLDKVSAPSLQNMLRIGYISRLEISRPEFTSVRPDFMDFSKLIVFGFLYSQFDQAVFDMLIGSSMIKEWNRANPGYIIDDQTKINDDFLTKILSRNAGQIKAQRTAIINPLRDWIASNKGLQADEKNIMVFLADRFLDNTRPFVWFILNKFSSFHEHQSLVHGIRDQLELFLSRSRIADYITLLLMELAISAETLNMKSFVERSYGRRTNFSSIFYDRVKRESLAAAMAESGNNFTIAWRIGNNNVSSVGIQKKLEMTIYNREAEYLELKEKFRENLSSGTAGTIRQFYQNADAGNAELGLLYLSHLQNECNNVGMRFTSRVGEARTGIPIITLTIQF